MVKLLTKYNKWILVVFGGLLMVAFLLPQTLQMMGTDPTTATRMTLDNRKVTVGEINEAAAKRGEAQRSAPEYSGAISSGEHWLLIAEQARRAGVLGNRFDGAAFIPTLAADRVSNAMNQAMLSRDFQSYFDLQKRQAELTASLEKELTNRANVRLTQTGQATVADALADTRGFVRLLNSFATAPRLSEARIIAAARKQSDEATVSYILVTPDAKSLADAGDVDQAAIDEHFAKFKDTPIGGGDLGIGYTYPDRVAVQYIIVDRSAITRLVVVDPIELQRRLMDKPADDTATPEQRRAQTELLIRSEKIDAIYTESLSTIRGELLRLTTALSDRDGYKVLPADGSFAARADLKAVADRSAAKVKAATGVDVQFTISGNAAALLSRSEFSSIPGLGAASARDGTISVDAADAVFSTLELRAPGSPRPRKLTQVGVPISTPFEDKQRNAHFILIREARKSAPAATSEEVRPQIVDAVKRLRVFEKLKADSAGIAVQGGVLGLSQLTDSLRASGYSVSEIKSDVRVSRERGALPAEPQVTGKPFVDAVMAKAERIDPTRTIGETDDLIRTLGVDAPARAGIVIAQITEFSPLTLDRLRAQLASGGYERMTQTAFTEPGPSFKDPQAAFMQLISLDAVAQRLGSREIGQDGNEKPTPSSKPGSKPATSPSAPTPPATPASPVN